MMRAIYWGLKNRTILLNLLFGGYLLFLQPIFLRRLETTHGYSIPDPLIGSILLMLPLIELAGVYLKRPVFAFRFAKRFPDSRSLFQDSRLQVLAMMFMFFSLLFGMSLSAVFTFAALKMLGVISPAMLCLPLFPVMMFRAYFVMMLWYGTSFGEIAMKAPKQISMRLAWRDLLSDVLLLFYAAIGYTALWDANPFLQESALGNFFFIDFLPGTSWGDDFFALLYLLAVYIVLRSVYLVQDVFLEKSRTARLWSFLSFVAVLLIAIISIPQKSRL
jgi:hypothetical protein